jgi:hypothetical protein
MFSKKSFTFVLSSSVAVDTTDSFVVYLDKTFTLKGACTASGALLSTSNLCSANPTLNTAII